MYLTTFSQPAHLFFFINLATTQSLVAASTIPRSDELATMSFAFGFSGDDIEGQDADATAAQVDSLSLDDARPSAPAIQVQRLSLDDMVSRSESGVNVA